MTAVENFVIRSATLDQVRTFCVEQAASEGWNAAIDDGELFYNTDPTGFLVGELDGKPISCVSAVKYGSTFLFGGLYIVQKEYRGKGYGLAIWKRCFESLPSTYNYGLDAIQDKAPLYAKWGFQETWTNRRVRLEIESSSDTLESFCPPSNVIVEPANQVDFTKLSAYDSTVFGAPHELFLRGLLDGPNTITLAATSTDGVVVGFVAARKTIIEKDGWKIAPMFADNGQIARTLLKATLNEMCRDAPERTVANVDFPPDINPEAHVLFQQELKATYRYDMSRMFTKGPLDVPKEKIFGFASAELG